MNVKLILQSYMYLSSTVLKTPCKHVNDKLLHVNALDTILTETDIFPNTSSGIGPLSFFINLSRHVVINSIQINTSDYQSNTQIHVNKTPITLK